MAGRGIVESVADSSFLAGLGERDRAAPRIIGAIIGGLVVGAVAATACLILVLIAYTVVTGEAGAGLEGMRRVAISLRDSPSTDLGASSLRLLVAASTNGAFVLAFVALAARLAGHRFIDYITAAPQIRWRLIGVGLVLSALMLAPVLFLDREISRDGSALPILAVSPSFAGRAAYAFAALLFIPAAAAEEAFFRGWLLRQTAAFARQPVVLIAFTAVVFSALHFDFSPGAFFTRALMGAGFAYMTLRLGGIEFATGVHAANNILIILFVEPLTLKATQSAGDLSAGSLLEDAIMVAGYLIITEAVVRIEPLRRWAGVHIEDLTRCEATARTFS
ncbi:MAG TPA: CPBP family intramembrane glutamic endopeptidase [Caulobacteraceae bacterium]|nr:CPBP family intramembrane glutamic endopeptidase [Caulobacteraceae bacterium]